MRTLLIVFLVLLTACGTEMIPVDVEIEPDPVPEPIVVKGVVDTMQAHCYDSVNAMNCSDGRFSGQDAQYQGFMAAYEDNEDGTVTDFNTDLMWQQDPGSKMTYPEAVAGAAAFTLGGYDDWRLPTIKELYSLMDFRGVDVNAEGDGSNGKPFLGTPFVFKYGDVAAGDRIIDSQWVTSTVYVDTVMNGEECFFGVNFADGRIKCYPTSKGKTYYTLYVRGEPYGETTFLATSQDVVVDRSTGLLWMRKDSGHYGFGGEGWEEALAFCEALTLAGKEWRLPNAKELQYIVDYTRSPGVTNSAAIDPVFAASSITNEAGEKDYPFYWTSTTHVSEQGGQQAVYVAFGRAMGKMQGRWMDVHGAGAQRSDPKIGDAVDYPDGFGPQGDARRIENYIRCVSGGAEAVAGASAATAPVKGKEQLPGLPPGTELPKKLPPAEAIFACQAKGPGTFCRFDGEVGKIIGHCKQIGEVTACVPD